jgi:hypothetical protein
VGEVVVQKPKKISVKITNPNTNPTVAQNNGTRRAARAGGSTTPEPGR